MYLTPPCKDFNELQARIDNRETFRVFKRPVKTNTKDQSFLRFSKSTIMLPHNGEIVAVRVTIFKGKVTGARLLAPSFEDLPEMDFVEKKQTATDNGDNDDLSFSELLAHMNSIERKLQTKEFPK